MGILLIIMLVTLALAWKARVAQRCWRPAEAEGADDKEMLDAFARASVLVFLSLLSLLVLGVTYGNVLGVHASP
jgi:hypothetical protein